jgi:hypothetical protein
MTIKIMCIIFLSPNAPPHGRSSSSGVVGWVMMMMLLEFSREFTLISSLLSALGSRKAAAAALLSPNVYIDFNVCLH